MHPGPLSDQARIVLGLELGTGVSVATIVADPPVGTLDGAESCSVKLLVMVTAADTCFEGSATLCAVSVTLVGDGRIPGAVNVPLASTVPHALGQAAPERLQRMVVSGWPLLVTVTWNAFVAPSSTLAGFGVSARVMLLKTVTLRRRISWHRRGSWQ